MHTQAMLTVERNWDYTRLRHDWHEKSTYKAILFWSFTIFLTPIAGHES